MQIQRACLATRRKNKLASECCRILPLVTGNERIMANIARQRERLPSTTFPVMESFAYVTKVDDNDNVMAEVISEMSGRDSACNSG